MQHGRDLTHWHTGRLAFVQAIAPLCMLPQATPKADMAKQRQTTAWEVFLLAEPERVAKAPFKRLSKISAA